MLKNLADSACIQKCERALERILPIRQLQACTDLALLLGLYSVVSTRLYLSRQQRNTISALHKDGNSHYKRRLAHRLFFYNPTVFYILATPSNPIGCI
jgi:hypothetical protein